jgi:PAS domain S-box-containing protein
MTGPAPGSRRKRDPTDGRSVTGASLRERTLASPDRPVAVAAVGDGEFVGVVESALSPADGVEVVTASDPATVASGLDGIDCLVAGDGDGYGSLHDAARSHDPAVPLLVLTGGSPEVELTDRWTEWLPYGSVASTDGLLLSRVRALFDRRRTQTLARRVVAATEAVPDGVAVAGPDGEFRLANRSFERRFGYGRDELLGQSWRTVFAPGAVSRIEDSLLSTAERRWRWTGTCEAERASGEAVAVETSVDGLWDGSLAFVVSAGKT